MCPPVRMREIPLSSVVTQIGTDDIIDLTEGWSPRDRFPLDFDKLSPNTLSQVSFLFGGVGDGQYRALYIR